MAGDDMDLLCGNRSIEGLNRVCGVGRAIGGIVVGEQGDSEPGEGICGWSLWDLGEGEEIDGGGIMSSLFWGGGSEALHQGNRFEDRCCWATATESVEVMSS